MSDAPVIETVALAKRYGPVTALDQLTIRVEAGEVYGFLGPNGAGKTTTIRLLLGLARPTEGEARLFGLDAWRDATTAHRRVGFVPGEFATWPNLRGREILDLFGSVHGGYDAKRRDELCQRFEFDPSRQGRDYSKGNRQKICLIAALMVQPDLLVLDEPTNGLDPLMEVSFRDCIQEAKQRGQTVFLSSHILSEVEALCDRVAILRSRPPDRGRHARRVAPSKDPRGEGHLRRGPARPVVGRRRRAGHDRRIGRAPAARRKPDPAAASNRPLRCRRRRHP